MNFRKLMISKLAGGAPAMDPATLVSMPMSGRNTHWRRLRSRCVTLAGTAVLAGSLFGQGNSGNAPKRVPLSEDWTDHQVVFSNPASPQKAVEVSKDPRF